tara:strand:- start:565 stop:882 length:318 start_codon:yes stop_codon:yes gene_type:complete
MLDAQPVPSPHLTLTNHSLRRMAQRGIRQAALMGVLRHGRCLYVRGAQLYVVGKREVQSAAQKSLDLRHLEGIHVVCSPEGVVLTVYRNKNLNLRPRRIYRRRSA